MEFDWSTFSHWLNKWQTLVGAAIAIPLSALAIAVTLGQESVRRRRRSVAVRATMPLRLSAVSQYAQDAGRALGACRTSSGVNTTAVRAFAKPPIPNGLIDGLEKTIEATGNQRVVRRLAKMIGEMQVLDSRMSGIRIEDLDGS